MNTQCNTFFRLIDITSLDGETQGEFSYYKNLSLCSTMRPDIKEEVNFRPLLDPKNLMKMIPSTSFLYTILSYFPWAQRLLGRIIYRRFKSQKTLVCLLTTLSAFIENEKISKIDLLKIDVEELSLQSLKELKKLTGKKSTRW